MNTEPISEADLTFKKIGPQTGSLFILRVFCFLMACGVAMGAFGAHALKGIRSEAQMETWKTATLYLLIHALAGAIFALPRPHMKIPYVVLLLFLGGCVVFAGSLYALVLTQIGFLGAITPIGGLMLISGWSILTVSAKSAASDKD